MVEQSGEGGTNHSRASGEPDILMSDERLGSYRIRECLTHNLLGSLYSAVFEGNSSGPEDALIFLLTSKVAQDPDFGGRFQMYCGRLEKLRGEAILQCIAGEEIDGRFCIRYEGFPGHTVDAFLKGAGDDGEGEGATIQPHLPDPQWVEAFARAVAGAFDVAHGAGLHHYGFHTSSVLVGDSDPNQIKLWGVGIFEMIGQSLFEKIVSAGVSPIRTARHEPIVTPVDSLSPEMRKGEKTDSRADIYSLGNVTYRLLTGDPVERDLVPPTQKRSEVPEFWDRILERCLDPDPNRRYSSVVALMRALESRGEKAEPDGESDVPAGRAGRLAGIPIPAALQRRMSARAVVLVRLAMLGAFGVFVIGLGSFSYRMIMGVAETERETVVIRRVNVAEEAGFVLETDPARAEVIISGPAQERFYVQNGILLVDLDPGDYRLTVRSPLHHPSTASISVTDEPQEIRVRLRPAWAKLVLRTLPGSRLYAGTGEAPAFVDEVPDAGVLTLDERLFATEYAFSVMREGYVSAVLEPVGLDSDATTELEVELEPISGVVTVRSEPEGATVFLDGVDMGVTPLELKDLPVGEELDFTVGLAGYRTLSETIALEPGGRESLDFGRLDLKRGGVALHVRTKRGPFSNKELGRVTIVVDDEVLPDGGTARLDLPAGERRIRVAHPDFHPFEQTIRVDDGATGSVDVTLEPRAARLALAFPDGFNSPYALRVDGSSVRGRDGVYPVPVWRKVELELRVRDHFPIEKTVELDPNERSTWTVEPERIPAPVAGDSWTPPEFDYSFAWIPAGSFRMGSPMEELARAPNEGDSRGRPISVTLSRGFWMGMVPVSQRLYQQIMGENPSGFPGMDHPVESVSWMSAREFARRLNEREKEANRIPEGYEYRLPTEVEWEYAARAGSDMPFSWGDDATPEQGNFRGSYPREARGGEVETIDRYGTSPVGAYEPNAWGLHDVHGNLWEWCINPFHERYPSGDHTDDLGLADSGYRPVRGGSWEDFAHRCRSAARDRKRPGFTGRSVGFRIALAPLYTGE